MCGERVREATPAGQWSTLTLLGGMTGKGLWAAMTVESPTAGEVFLAYLDQVLCPRLQPGQIVILDNLGARWLEERFDIGFFLTSSGAGPCSQGSARL